MPALNTLYRIYYVSKDSLSGLIDVTMYVQRPDATVEGPFTMTEIADTNFAGTYYVDYMPVIAGFYIFKMDSASVSKPIERSVEIRQGSPFATF